MPVPRETATTVPSRLYVVSVRTINIGPRRPLVSSRSVSLDGGSFVIARRLVLAAHSILGATDKRGAAPPRRQGAPRTPRRLGAVPTENKPTRILGVLGAPWRLGGERLVRRSRCTLA